jgi:hypothetical protein
MEDPAIPTHEECARLARQHWEAEQDPKRKEFLFKIAQMWAELAAVKQLEKRVNEGEPAPEKTERLVG